ncbi:hypothetical protein K437DRAFT_222953 [Tilletiaria anomala UBC 951]|uniref:Purine transporter n=1 Tax=Tilletiaria anomala (strain ATCC 24038 / CBS 436.72 / UBC 951) TaxID=1037660 RepID=A0A066W1A6_TILAU|nr:uncharacterized protein K437DRAFT_222953 [Tilletiaria anomala UBC 951]KDN47752.1 hypothetical protein K437DRAFT_222953 [Tilletiaria anomala UBC 951]
MATGSTKVSALTARLNDRIARSPLGRHFRLAGSGHPLERAHSRFSTEIRAGLVTAAAMLYIISVNASILSASGGPCVCSNPSADDPICDNNAEYNICKNELRRDYVTATSAISTMVTFLLGALANLPLGASAGLGVNSYFAFSVVGYNGQGLVPYGQALAAVFLEGWIFLFLSLIGLRQWVGRLLPRSLNLATGAGIGFFLCLIGLGPSGLGAIGGNATDLVGLGGCPAQYKDANGFCESHVLQDPRMWVGILLGGMLTALLLVYRVKGALLWPILLVAISSWPRGGNAVTLFPHTAEGDSNWDFFKQVATWHGFSKISVSNIDFDYANGKVWLALISFLYVDIMDTTGTLFAMSRHAGLMDDRSGDFEGSSIAFLVDAFCISMSALLGMSPSTVFVESASGIAEGGRTGITAITVSFVFFLSLFFAPIFSSIPSWATGSTLVIVGSMMARNTSAINWNHPKDAIPAFIAMTLIPFSFNIAYGLIAAICTWIVLHNVPLLLTWASRGLIPLPQGWEQAEPYSASFILANATSGELPSSSLSSSPSGASPSTLARLLAILPPWLRRLAGGKRRFWEMEPSELEAYVEGRKATLEKERRKQEEREREWAEEREAMLKVKEAGQDVIMPPHHREYPVGALETDAARRTPAEEDDNSSADKDRKLEQGGFA